MARVDNYKKTVEMQKQLRYVLLFASYACVLCCRRFAIGDCQQS